MKVLGQGFARPFSALTRRFSTQRDDVSELVPVLLSGSGRTGSVALMSLLGSDRRLAFDQQYPFESRYLTYFVKFALLINNPEYLPFIEGSQLFSLNTLGVSAVRPQQRPNVDPKLFLPRLSTAEWLKSLWKTFSAGIQAENPNTAFYAEKAPQWLPALVRDILPCFTIYNFRDIRDVFLSANAFSRKQKAVVFGRHAGDTDLEYARGLALSFCISYEKYRSDRQRADSVLVRYEDLVEKPQVVAERLQKMAGLSVSQAGMTHFEQHRTAKDLSATVRRWQREEIPFDVSRFFQEHLSEEMESLGYQVNSPSPAFKRTISLRQNASELAGVSCDGGLRERPDDVQIDLKGPGFWMTVPVQPFEAKTINQIWLSFNAELDGTVALYWRAEQMDFAEIRSLKLGYSASAQWWVLSFPVQSHPEWKGTIYQLRINFSNPSPSNRTTSPHGAKGYIRWIRLIG